MNKENIAGVKIYTHEELQYLKDTCNKIILTLPNDFDTAVDIICMVADSLYDDKEDFILRFRAIKNIRRNEND